MTGQNAPLKDTRFIDDKQVAAAMRRDLADKVDSLTESGWPPKLVSIAVGDAEPAMLYIRNQRRVAELLEIAFEERSYSGDVSQDELLAAVQSLNADPRVTGVII